jgi:hypothetical protein
MHEIDIALSQSKVQVTGDASTVDHNQLQIKSIQGFLLTTACQIHHFAKNNYNNFFTAKIRKDKIFVINDVAFVIIVIQLLLGSAQNC